MSATAVPGMAGVEIDGGVPQMGSSVFFGVDDPSNWTWKNIAVYALTVILGIILSPIGKRYESLQKKREWILYILSWVVYPVVLTCQALYGWMYPPPPKIGLPKQPINVVAETISEFLYLIQVQSQLPRIYNTYCVFSSCPLCLFKIITFYTF